MKSSGHITALHFPLDDTSEVGICLSFLNVGTIAAMQQIQLTSQTAGSCTFSEANY